MAERKTDGWPADGNESARAPQSVLAPFRHRLFLSFWAASLLSNVGGQIQSVGAAWLMTSLTASAQLVALVATATLLPVLLFSLPFGAAADVFERRKVLLCAQLIMFGASLALSLCAFADMLNPGLLLFLTFLLGCGFALNNPAWHASVGELVPTREISSAVSLNIVGFNLARTVGPAAGGVIVAAMGPEGAFAVNAASYLALLAVLLVWRPEPRDSKLGRETIAGAIGGGLRYVGNARGVNRIVGRACLYGLCLSALMALMPLVARDLLDGTSATFGILLSCAGVGAIVGALVAPRLRRSFSGEKVVRAAQLATALAILVASLSRDLVLTAAAQTLSGLSMVLTMSTFNVTVQLSVPRWVAGRALSIYQMGTFGGLAIGAWLWGAVAEAAGISVSLQLACAVLIGAVALGLRFPIADPDPELLKPAERHGGPDLPGVMEDANAPVSVTVEYRIVPENRDAFLQLMRERRQLRRREGARRWSLAQDAADPELWIERYVRSSWTDFLRYRNRRTIEEERNLDQLIALHAQPERPQVRFLIDRDVGQTRPVWTGPGLE